MSQRCGYEEDTGGVLKSLSIKTSAQADFKFSANRVCVKSFRSEAQCQL